MKPINLLLTLLPAVLVEGNFILWKQKRCTAFGCGNDEWHLVQTDNDFYCSRPTRTYGASDVSGNKLGVRCKGNCDLNAHPDGIDELEMHFGNNPKTHWTLYKNRGVEPMAMIGLDGKTYGECYYAHSDAKTCSAGPPFYGNTPNWFARKKFRCNSLWTAQEIYDTY